MFYLKMDETLGTECHTGYKAICTTLGETENKQDAGKESFRCFPNSSFQKEENLPWLEECKNKCLIL